MGGKPRKAERALAATPARHRAVAFLRGMNLGRRRITNQDLGEIFAAMGFSNVTVFLASGNVIFDSPLRGPSFEQHIAEQLCRALDYEVPTFVRSADQVTAIAEHRPFTDDVVSQSAGKIQVMMLRAVPTEDAQRRVLALATEDDRLAIRDREIYWLPIGNLSDSALEMRAIQKAVGDVTIRTQRTITRIAAKFL